MTESHAFSMVFDEITRTVYPSNKTMRAIEARSLKDSMTMEICNEKRPSGEPAVTLDDLHPGTTFRVRGGTAVYIVLHPQAYEEDDVFNQPMNSFYKTQIEGRPSNPHVTLPDGHIPAISLESGRIFSWLSTKEVWPVPANVVVRT